MKEEELKPTIENPFSKDKILPKNILKKRDKNASAPPKIKKIFQPSYFISSASKDYIAKEVEHGNLDIGEVETIYNLAKQVSNIFKRRAPTYSDIQIALTFRTINHIRQIASGEEQFDTAKHNMTSSTLMSKNDRLQYWKIVAERLIQEFETESENTQPSS